MKKPKKLFPFLILIGVVTPAILSLYFISQLGLDTIYQDEWGIARIVTDFFGGGDEWREALLIGNNEHRPIFPWLIILGLAHFTSYNTYYEIFVGWLFLSLTLFIFWRLLSETNANVRWLIIPLAWMTYSFNQLENLLWGYPSIQWNLVPFSVVTSLYFLNKIKNSNLSIVPAIFFGIVGTFSNLLGALVWFIGLNTFKNAFRNRVKLLSIYLIVLFSTILFYFILWDPFSSNETLESGSVFSSLTLFNDPLDFIKFIFSYLGNGIFYGAYLLGIERHAYTIILGAIIVSIFSTMILLYHRCQIFRYNNLQPWFNIALFGILATLITAIGRVDRFGPEIALSPRYYVISNLFWESTLVFTVVVFLHLIKTANTKKQKTIFKICLGSLLILLSVHIADGYIQGWILGNMWVDNINIGGSCLLNLDLADEDCKILHPRIEEFHKTITDLKENCLGPFSTLCK